MNKYLYYNDQEQGFLKAENKKQAEKKLKEINKSGFNIVLFTRN